MSNSWEIVIGLETHAQLRTNSKIFSGASIAFGASPNVQACAVDLALPGVLPVLNKAAVECAIRFGLAVGAEIAPRSVFARKNYFYPDLPKGYQISQFELPVVKGGTLTILVAPSKPGAQAYEKTVHLTRAHLEEDAGKSLHEDFHGKTGIDLNRAGTPLLEIVTEPDMCSAAEAVAYAKALHALVRWVGICDGNMQEGSFRCDANVSVRRPGEPLGTRREIKNLNSFRFLQQAIEYEVKWQIETLEDGGRIHQATVLFDPATGQTRSMRSKEDAQDYRYFPDPDLLPLEIAPTWIASVKAAMPELPAEMRTRFEREYGLSAYDAVALTASREIAQYFEDCLTAAGKEKDLPPTPLPGEGGDGSSLRSMVITAPPRGGPSATLAKTCANWIMGDLAARLNKDSKEIGEAPVSPVQLASLVLRIADNTISNKLGKDVFDALWNGEGASADAIIEAKGLKQITDSGAIEKLIDEVLAANPKSVEEFRAGKEKAFNALVGQAMKATKGKANPQQVNELLRKKLGG